MPLALLLSCAQAARPWDSAQVHIGLSNGLKWTHTLSVHHAGCIARHGRIKRALQCQPWAVQELYLGLPAHGSPISGTVGVCSQH